MTLIDLLLVVDVANMIIFIYMLHTISFFPQEPSLTNSSRWLVFFNWINCFIDVFMYLFMCAVYAFVRIYILHISRQCLTVSLCLVYRMLLNPCYENKDLLFSLQGFL